MSKTPKSPFSLQNVNFRYKFLFDQNPDFVLGPPPGAFYHPAAQPSYGSSTSSRGRQHIVDSSQQARSRTLTPTPPMPNFDYGHLVHSFRRDPRYQHNENNNALRQTSAGAVMPAPKMTNSQSNIQIGMQNAHRGMPLHKGTAPHTMNNLTSSNMTTQGGHPISSPLQHSRSVRDIFPHERTAFSGYPSMGQPPPSSSPTNHASHAMNGRVNYVRQGSGHSGPREEIRQPQPQGATATATVVQRSEKERISLDRSDANGVAKSHSRARGTAEPGKYSSQERSSVETDLGAGGLLVKDTDRDSKSSDDAPKPVIPLTSDALEQFNKLSPKKAGEKHKNPMLERVNTGKMELGDSKVVQHVASPGNKNRRTDARYEELDMWRGRAQSAEQRLQLAEAEISQLRAKLDSLEKTSAALMDPESGREAALLAEVEEKFDELNFPYSAGCDFVF